MSTKTFLLLFMPLLLAAGCAARDIEPAASIPTTSEEAARDLAGTWRGVETGRDFATASGLADVQTTVAIRPDGTWSLRSATGEANGRVIRAREGLVLDGRFVTGRFAGESIRYVLTPNGPRGLVGSGQTFFGGVPVNADVVLQRTG